VRARSAIAPAPRRIVDPPRFKFLSREGGGFWFYLLVTPLIGTWALGVTVKLLRVRPATLLAPSFPSVLGFGLAIAAALARGIEWFG
jgi:hypothetical protein